MIVRHILRGVLAVAAIAGSLLSLGGCAGTATAPEVAPSAVQVSAMPLTIPDPSGKAVLTLSGKIGAANQGEAMVLDDTAMDGLRKVDLTVSDPFEKRKISYKGVWLSDLLRAAEVAADARKLQMTALDDYVVELTMDEVRSGGIFLAVSNADGSAIPVADGGPTRIVFADGTASGNNSDQWIWSLVTIEVQ
jgi:hypothetical protein